MKLKNNKKKCKVSKRPMLLLELMIAFMLVVLCAFPLLYPHFYMIKAEKEAICTIELDRLIGFIYADIIVKLYRNEIPWSEIESNQAYPIDKLMLSNQLVQQLTATQYTGSYSFEKIDKTQSDDINDPISHHHMKVVFTFTNSRQPRAHPIIVARSFYIKRDAIQGSKSAHHASGGI